MTMPYSTSNLDLPDALRKRLDSTSQLRDAQSLERHHIFTEGYLLGLYQAGGITVDQYCAAEKELWERLTELGAWL